MKDLDKETFAPVKSEMYQLLLCASSICGETNSDYAHFQGFLDLLPLQL